MGLLRFIHTPKHQRFEYKPRHWDPQKEDLYKRLELIEKVKENDIEALKARIAQNIRRGSRQSTRSRQKSVLLYNLMLVGIIVVLVFLTYLFLVVYLPEISNALGS